MPNGFPLAAIAFYVAVAPIITVHISYWIAAGVVQAVPECFPYWEGCTSISAAGRSLPASFVFRPLMIGQGVLLAIFWAFAAVWLRAIGLAAGPVNTAAWVGAIGGVFLILYTTFLGSSGDFYYLMRRYGITIYFAFTILAAMLLARLLVNRFGWRSEEIPAVMARRQILLCVVLLALGLASIPAQHFVADDDRLENAIEWSLSLLMHGNFLLYAWAWHRLDLRFGLQSREPR